jgi:hypothetical protein
MTVEAVEHCQADANKSDREPLASPKLLLSDGGSSARSSPERARGVQINSSFPVQANVLRAEDGSRSGGLAKALQR